LFDSGMADYATPRLNRGLPGGRGVDGHQVWERRFAAAALNKGAVIPMEQR
jgi:hypothetical protein